MVCGILATASMGFAYSVDDVRTEGKVYNP